VDGGRAFLADGREAAFGVVGRDPLALYSLPELAFASIRKAAPLG
jgi:hypothetical protein